jgi:hypothetical protein
MVIDFLTEGISVPFVSGRSQTRRSNASVDPFSGFHGKTAFTIARHGSRPAGAAPRDVNISLPLPGMIDVALFDGHVEKSPPENLWNYYWSSTWEIPNPRPGR